MDVAEISSYLAGLPVPQIQYFDVTGSTNDVALNWLGKGAADGCLVVADRQTHGRGRLGRQWITRSGSALAFSIIIHPTSVEQARMSHFTALGALAICQALEAELALRPEIKWPNDVLLDGHKAAGILVETAWLGEQLQGLVIGMGLNVRADAVPPAGELMFPATSVEESAGREVERVALLRSILRALFAWRLRMTDKAFLQAWEQRLAFKGEWVRVEGSAHSAGGQPLSGLVSGLDEAGNLLLQIPSGETVSIGVGDVHLRTAE